MIGRLLLFGALLVSIAVVVIAACTPQPTTRPSPSPTGARTSTPVPATAAPTPTAARTAAPTTAAPSPSPTVPPSPGSTPATACPPLGGGSDASSALLTAVRAAHHPGFDRLVFEFGPMSGGRYGMPLYRIEVATSFTAPSGQAVRVDGNALFGVRLQGTAAHTESGAALVGPTPYRPGLPVIREVRLVEDFEAVVIEGVGLERLVCPSVLTLTAPVRLVLDFPTPP